MSMLLRQMRSHGLQLVTRHIYDWIAVLIILTCLICFELVPPNYSLFNLDDKAISYPMTKHEKVPNWLCLIISPLLVAVVIVLFTAGVSKSKNKVQLLHISILGLLLATTANGLITNMMKTWLGNPRPDFLSRCVPDPKEVSKGLKDISICTNPDRSILNEGFKSTPSGHSSNSFSGLLYLSLWLAGQLSAFKPEALIGSLAIVAMPLILAVYIATSRIADYRHHYTDVISGSLLGCIVAWFCYRKFFPAPSRSRSYEPYVNQSNDSQNTQTQSFIYDSENSDEGGAPYV